jgi:hypothetical protein
MRADVLAQTQLLMAQSVFALAEHIDQSTGYNLTPVTFADLPTRIGKGTIVCMTDSTVNTWGSAITVGGGTNTVLAFYDGTKWKVVG